MFFAYTLRYRTRLRKIVTKYTEAAWLCTV